MSLANKTAMIVGATGGLGGAIAMNLAEAGARPFLVGRNVEKLAALRSALSGARAIAAPCDVTDRGQVSATVETALAQCGAIDILVFAAGINVPKRSLRSLDPADWDRVLATNLTGVFNVLHFVLPSMRDRGYGVVIQISSIAAVRASVISGAAYSASKSGQSALGLCIGREERGRGIRSTVICPGEVNTGLLNQRTGRMDAVDSQRRESILQPEDVAAAVRFIVELPPRAHVPELIMKPTIDDFA
jgi:NADP-dependent 3-hydroxy acid dehydrogenase YdfG